jgi:hypothetical protein
MLKLKILVGRRLSTTVLPDFVLIAIRYNASPQDLHMEVLRTKLVAIFAHSSIVPK